MIKAETLHLLLKYESKYEKTDIDTIQEHIKVCDEKGQVIWGVFTTRGNNRFDIPKIHRLDNQVQNNIPTFIFFYNLKTESLYVADYIEAFERNGVPQTDIEFVPSYYQHLVNKDFIKGQLTCQSYVKVTNIRKIDFMNRSSIYNYMSGVSLSERSNSNTVFFVDMNKDLYELLSDEFVAYDINDFETKVIEEELNDRKIPDDLLQRIKVDKNPPNITDRKGVTTRKNKRSLKDVDFSKRQILNEKLGSLGEEYIFNYEIQKVKKWNKDWISKIKWISKDDKTSPYDIESVDEEGNTIYIEVKTTAGGKSTPFFASIYEMEFSHKEKDRYYLYRLFGFNAKEKTSCMYIKQGSLYKKCSHKPVQYMLW